jgi:4-hydroxy-tetrahydrodipicolinate reductase
MIYKVGVWGATGRMGQEVASLLHSGFTHRGALMELGDVVASSKKIRSVDGVPTRTPEEPVFQDVHVWIDFSRPEATLKLLDHARCPIVIGTTGFNEAELKRIKEYASDHAVLLAPNMSPGLNWILKMLSSVSLSAKESFDVVLSETHHKHKKDSPSGTLKAIKSVLGERDFNEPQVNVARAGEEKGTHQIQLFSECEEITITHRVLDRKVFAQGALLGAMYLLKKNQPGLYSYLDIDI